MVIGTRDTAPPPVPKPGGINRPGSPARSSGNLGFTFKQRNVFCYLCFLPLNDMGFHLDKHCKFSDIVPETIYALWRGPARTQVEARMGQRWETEAAWRAWLWYMGMG
jgi:hypothetical protein